MTYEDVLFYLPAFGSLALVGVSAVLSWVIWRMVAAARAKRKPVEKSGKT